VSGSDTRGRALHVALVHRDFRYLFASRAISGTGDWLYNVALLVYGSEGWGLESLRARINAQVSGWTYPPYCRSNRLPAGSC
jgi:hypothetical protein